MSAWWQGRKQALLFLERTLTPFRTPPSHHGPSFHHADGRPPCMHLGRVQKLSPQHLRVPAHPSSPRLSFETWPLLDVATSAVPAPCPPCFPFQVRYPPCGPSPRVIQHCPRSTHLSLTISLVPSLPGGDLGDPDSALSFSRSMNPTMCSL